MSGRSPKARRRGVRARRSRAGVAALLLVGPLALRPLLAAPTARACVQTAPTSAQLPAARASKPAALEVFVDGISGGAVYLDRGREAGLRLDQELELYPAGFAPVRARVVALSRSSARVQLLGSREGLEAGVRGLVLAREGAAASAPATGLEPSTGTRGAARREAAASRPANTPGPANTEGPAAADGQAPEDVPPDAPSVGGPERSREHAPWSPGSLEWEESAPLLAAPRTLRAEEREPDVWGSVFLDGARSEDHVGDDRRYQSWRSGLYLGAENFLGRGGTLYVDLEVERQSVDLGGDGSQHEEDMRVEELSWAWGGRRESPWRVQLGRFHQHELPELGRLDGVEFAHRSESGDRTALSLGTTPMHDAELGVSDDAQLALAHSFVFGAEETSALTLGAQRSYAGGTRERDLFVASLFASLSSRTSLFGSAWVDRYGEEARVKDEGLELTRWNLNLSHRFEGGHRAGLSASHFRYPEIERFAGLSPELLAHGHDDRVGLSLRYELSHDLACSTRLDRWADEESDGGAAELGLELDDLAWPQGQLLLAVFAREGRYSQSSGYRLSASRRFRDGRAQLAWSSARYEPLGIGDPDDEDADPFENQALRASLDLELAHELELGLYTTRRFSDEGEASTLGFQLRRRF